MPVTLGATLALPSLWASLPQTMLLFFFVLQNLHLHINYWLIRSRLIIALFVTRGNFTL